LYHIRRWEFFLSVSAQELEDKFRFPFAIACQLVNGARDLIPTHVQGHGAPGQRSPIPAAAAGDIPSANSPNTPAPPALGTSDHPVTPVVLGPATSDQLDQPMNSTAPSTGLGVSDAHVTDVPGPVDSAEIPGPDASTAPSTVEPELSMATPAPVVSPSPEI
ncbi:hypothetical protein PTTG_27561, partial [Puccinia triticina 1-1 BBBD Race 1]